MNRQHPFFSPVGCLGGGVLIVGLLIAILLTGGMIFSPGELTVFAAQGQPLQGFASHAEFQEDCTQCHAPFAGIEAARCEACHTAVRDERTARTGVHGRLPSERAARCGDCHDDHEGAQHDPTALALRQFDHRSIGFDLSRHTLDYAGLPLECRACHSVPGYSFLAASCTDCHSPPAPDFMQDHRAAFGDDCTVCHDGVDKTHGFDHQQTGFPLLGRHSDASCASCHQPATAPAETQSQCVACHAEPPAHASVFGTDCASCHSAEGWRPAQLPDGTPFDHSRTAFQLVNHSQNWDGQPLTCAACHSVPELSMAGQNCSDCHTAHNAEFMTQHVQQYGANCVGCHDGAGNMRGFDHTQRFALDGAHAPLACTACHVNEQFRNTPRECAACHAEPKIHAGIFGQQCQACHTTTAWAPAQLTQHTFPLDHGEEGEIACSTCHLATYTAYTCFNCHAHDQAETRQKHTEVNLGGRALEDCAACHALGKKEEGEH